MRSAFAAALLAALGSLTAGAARADIVHAYVLIESTGPDQDAVLAGIRDPGMCKWVPIGTVPTETPETMHIFIQFDCEGEESLSALIGQLGTGINGVTRASVLESFGRN